MDNNILIVKKDQTYKDNIVRDKDKKQYNDIYLKAVSTFGYLEMYERDDLFTIEDMNEFDPSGVSKTVMSLVALKGRLETNEFTTKAHLTAYTDFVNNYESLISYLMRVLSKYEEVTIGKSSSDVQEFFE